MYGSYRPRRRWLRWFLVYAAGVLAVAVIGLVIEAAVSPGSGQPQDSGSAFPVSPAAGTRASPRRARRRAAPARFPARFRWCRAASWSTACTWGSRTAPPARSRPRTTWSARSSRRWTRTGPRPSCG